MGTRLRQPAELLPWALLSVAALVLSASAADALRKGVPQPATQAAEMVLPAGAACVAGAGEACLQHPVRYMLEADAFALDSAELPKDLKGPLNAVADALR